MKLSESIQEGIKDAMKSGQKIRLSALRGIKTEITVALTAPGAPEELSDDDILKIIRKMVKQREDSIEQYTKGGRQDLADAESAEKDVLMEFLPKELTDKELDTIISGILSNYPEKSMKIMGKVMKDVNSQVQGRADGKKVADKVKKELMK